MIRSASFTSAMVNDGERTFAAQTERPKYDFSTNPKDAVWNNAIRLRDLKKSDEGSGMHFPSP